MGGSVGPYVGSIIITTIISTIEARREFGSEMIKKVL
jgi:hypothetical protein